MSAPDKRPNPMPTRALTLGEVAAKLGVTEQHVSNLIDEGAIQAINVGGGSKKFWRVPIEALAAFVEKRANLRSTSPLPGATTGNPTRRPRA